MLYLFIKFMFNCGQADGDGCYNLVCPGFVQISHKVGFGAILTPLSTYNGEQRWINLRISMVTVNHQKQIIFFFFFSLLPFFRHESKFFGQYPLLQTLLVKKNDSPFIANQYVEQAICFISYRQLMSGVVNWASIHQLERDQRS